MAIIIAVWWLAGIVSFAAVGWQGLRAFTWGDLLRCMILGFVPGLILWLVIGISLFAQADFWTKPIFGREQHHDL